MYVTFYCYEEIMKTIDEVGTSHFLKPVLYLDKPEAFYPS